MIPPRVDATLYRSVIGGLLYLTAPTLPYQGTNLEFRSTNSKDNNPSNSEAPTPRALTIQIYSVKKCLIVLYYFHELLYQILSL